MAARGKTSLLRFAHACGLFLEMAELESAGRRSGWIEVAGLLRQLLLPRQFPALMKSGREIFWFGRYPFFNGFSWKKRNRADFIIGKSEWPIVLALEDHDEFLACVFRRWKLAKSGKSRGKTEFFI